MSDQIDKGYLKGFNHGYLLTEHTPVLVNQLLETPSNNIYVDGLRDGHKSFELSQSKSRLKEIEKIRTQKGKNLDQEK